MILTLRNMMALVFSVGLLVGCAHRDAAQSPFPLTNGGAPEDGCFYCPNDGVGSTFGTGYPGGY